jgi:hypothetical protein
LKNKEEGHAPPTPDSYKIDSRMGCGKKKGEDGKRVISLSRAGSVSCLF